MTMKTLLGAMMLSGALLCGASAAQAMTVMVHKQVKVLDRAPDGRATRVEVAGQDYAVCSATVQDSCINPRQAGLHFGDRPLGYWPGHAAHRRDKAA